MNNLFTTGLGLTVRMVVDATISYGRLGASVVGLSEGIILYHSRPGTLSFDASTSPYAAFALRIVLDLVYTRNVYRMAIVLLWTSLGVVLADILESMSASSHRRSHKHHSKEKPSRPSSKPIEAVTENRRHSRTHRSTDLLRSSRNSTRAAQIDVLSPRPTFPTWKGETNGVDLVLHPPESDHDEEGLDLFSSAVFVENDVDLLQTPPLAPTVDPDNKTPAIDTLTLTLKDPADVDDGVEVPITDLVDDMDMDDHSLLEELSEVEAEDADATLPSGIPLTLASDQSPERVVKDVTEPDEPQVDSDEPTSPADENKVPIPVPVHDSANVSMEQIDTDVVVVADVSASIDTPLSAQPKDRATLVRKAKMYRAKAVIAMKERDKLEADRKLAIKEGRDKDSFLRGGDRDKMADKVTKYEEKAAELFFRADNLGLPPDTIDIHRSPIPNALVSVRDRFQQMLRQGEPQLRVIVSPEPTSELTKRLQHELKIQKISSFFDQYRHSFLLTVPKSKVDTDRVL